LLFYLSLIETDADKRKFEIMYEKYKDLMFRIAQDILNNDHDAEDAVHHAFLNVIDVLPRVDNPVCSKTKALLSTIVENAAIDIYRKHKRQPLIPLDESYINSLSPSEADRFADRSEIAKAIAALPTRYRQVILLKYDQGYSHREIAGLLSMEEANVRKILQRAKEKLSGMLQEEEV